MSNRSRWARVVGILYVLTNLFAMAAYAMRAQVVVGHDTVATAANLQLRETIYRGALAVELLTVVGVLALVVGLHAILRDVDRNLALLAAFWRVMENAVLALITFAGFFAVTVVEVARTLQPMDAASVQAISYALVRTHIYGFQVGFLFLGLGSTLFAWLWLKSRLIPRWVALWGIFASLLIFAMAVAIIVHPPVLRTVSLAYMAPLGLFEIGFGLWLSIRGLPAAEDTSPKGVSA